LAATLTERLVSALFAWKSAGVSAAGDLVFAVPLKPSAVSTSWRQVEENLRRTARSARAAAGFGRVQIVIAGHDLPELGDADGPDVSRLLVPFAVPGSPAEGKRDKARKRRFIGAWLRQHLPADEVCVVFLDADDLLHRDLGQYLRSTAAPSYVIEDGYVLATDRSLLIRHPHAFHRRCGSTFICRFDRGELPETWEDEDAAFSQFGSTPEQRGHQDYDAVAAELGKPPIAVPFPAAVYVANHAESLWVSKGRPLRTAAHPRLIVPPRRARPILGRDFSAPDWAATIAGNARTYAIVAQTAATFTVARLTK
jgi:hypothetical protein